MFALLVAGPAAPTIGARAAANDETPAGDNQRNVLRHQARSGLFASTPSPVGASILGGATSDTPAPCPGSLPDSCPSGYQSVVAGCYQAPACPAGSEEILTICYASCPSGYTVSLDIFCKSIPAHWYDIPHSVSRPKVPKTNGVGLKAFECPPGTRLAGAKAIGISVGYCYQDSCFDQTIGGEVVNAVGDIGSLFTSSYANYENIEKIEECLKANMNNFADPWPGIETAVKQMFSSTTGFISIGYDAFHSFVEPSLQTGLLDVDTFVGFLTSSYRVSVTALGATAGDNANLT
ncbi:hypothetical protein EMIHUDRAFT_109923 [Emiliania huxleyi CCMP1516]|uniref:Uncharacterized protein n=2 Tax=Emiliania huxleyi TaxID=2903 RepID=A0A0D3KNE4_EMIH1|nr:hypothetical protein EMIHUDRAFT_109923 [Emiliania huxleyi CCMP1516]EOD37279.1 hypothetical protein EMIHUDRAFT_109923 [Emiliania huxleyi CCMP1516]|eukprot:XP_005789708.1 hypothetical protein EMIHUDRAFT_109923 [Emiliania huxleyi CCMP1516]